MVNADKDRIENMIKIYEKLKGILEKQKKDWDVPNMI